MNEQLAKWRVDITQTAAKMIRDISDARIRSKILDAIAELKHDPALNGKPMVGDLATYRSLRVVGQRYRVIYAVQAQKVTVYVVAAGTRKAGDKADIYELAKKLLRLGLLDPPPEPSS